MKSIVIIEDNFFHREMLETLVKSHFECEVHSYSCAEDFFTSAVKHLQCIYLIDWKLPGINGVDIVRVIRSRDLVSPIFVITGSLTPENAATSIEAGADLYISKPYTTEYLVNHVTRARTRSDAIKAQSLNSGIKLFEEAGMVIKDGVPITLTGREFRVFQHLHSDYQRVWKREDLCNSNSYQDLSGRTIDVVISSLRKKISMIDLEVETIRGEGYQLKGM